MKPPRFDVPVPRGGYAWWYVDALSDDGTRGLTVIAFVGSVFSPYYAHARHRGGAASVDPLEHCAINVALYGPGDARWSMTERRGRAVTRDATRLSIGPSRLEWTARGLRLSIDEVAVPWPRRIRGTIDLDIATLHDEPIALDPRGRHRWTALAPRARIAVDLAAPRTRWTGAAYLDGNAGDVPLEDDFVRWDWSRAHLADGRAAVVYDVVRRDAPPLSIARWFDASGASGPFDAPPPAPLHGTRWGLRPTTRCDEGAVAARSRSLEDGPFYARSVVDTHWLGERVESVHEHLSLDRFGRRWVRALLPFRMPRRLR